MLGLLFGTDLALTLFRRTAKRTTNPPWNEAVVSRRSLHVFSWIDIVAWSLWLMNASSGKLDSLVDCRVFIFLDFWKICVVVSFLSISIRRSLLIPLPLTNVLPLLQSFILTQFDCWSGLFSSFSGGGGGQRQFGCWPFLLFGCGATARRFGCWIWLRREQLFFFLLWWWRR
jgi:hypothetical protein